MKTITKLFSVVFLPVFIDSSYCIAQNNELKFEHLTIENGLSQNTVSSIAKDKYGFIWIGTWNGLNRYDGYSFKIYKNDPVNAKSITNNRIVTMIIDNKGTLWVITFGTSQYICRYNELTDDFSRFNESEVRKTLSDTITKTYNSKNQTLRYKNYQWELNNQSLTRKNLKTGLTTVFISNPMNPNSISSNLIYRFYFDNTNVFWFGTVDAGVSILNMEQKPFIHYKHFINDKDGLIDNNIRAIYEDENGILWIGTRDKGITKFDRKNNTYTHYQNIKDKSNSLCDNQIRKIYKDRYGYIWIGTKAGLCRLNPKNGNFERYSIRNTKSQRDWFFWIMEDHQGTLLVASWDGFCRYNRDKDEFIIYNSSTQKWMPENSHVRIIVEDKNNTLWIGYDGQGVTKLEKGNNPADFDKMLKPTQYMHDTSNVNSLSDNRIYSIQVDENNDIWIGTSNGLNKYNKEKGTFTLFDEKQGLADAMILGILNDDKGHLWLSHKKGISKFDIKTHEVRNYSTVDGLQSMEFNEDAYFKSKSGELFFGGPNGFNAFFPDNIKDNPFLPKMVITDFLIDNKQVQIGKEFNGRIILNQSITASQEITLTYRDRSFSLEFAALHYVNPKNNKYAYKLEGFDKEWIYTDAANRKANYSNLNAGTYLFKVKGTNNEGLWNETPCTLLITIQSPWWKTWWFKLIALFILIGSIYIAYSLRIALYQKKQKELSVLVKQRTHEITQANDTLLERQARIEEYAEELRAHTENLREANELLINKQNLIETQDEQLKNTNQQLSIINSTKDRFFSIIAHDLRNPFHAVSGFAEVLIRDYKKLPPEKIERFLNIIYTSSTNGNNLLENLLQWSRSQTGRSSYEPTELNISIIAEETINLLEGDAQRKNITIQQLIKPNVTIFADKNMVKTILRNLISNAIKFSHENGTVIINSNIIDQQLEITIADTGVGITPENLSLLFRIDTTVTTKGTANETGTGLGLILCKEFVEKHNGKIWVESKEGKGSEFKFTLPLA